MWLSSLSALSSIFSCLAMIGNTSKAEVFRYITEPSNVVEKCIFCKIGDGRMKPGKNDCDDLIYENERIVAFHDINPGANEHLLVVPKEHVKNCWYLSPELLDEMNQVADQLLEKINPENNSSRKFFIRPPLNSVYHVHLHVMVLPLTDPFYSARRLGFVSPLFHISPDKVKEHFDNNAR